MSTDLLDAEALTSAYVNLRNTIRGKEEDIKELKEKLHTVGDKLLEMCQEQGLDSFRSEAGTVTRRLRSTYWTSDWDEMYKFIEHNNAAFLLEKRIHNGNMKEFLEDHPDACPLGLQSKNEYTVSVRKPTAK